MRVVVILALISFRRSAAENEEPGDSEGLADSPIGASARSLAMGFDSSGGVDLDASGRSTYVNVCIGAHWYCDGQRLNIQHVMWWYVSYCAAIMVNAIYAVIRVRVRYCMLLPLAATELNRSNRALGMCEAGSACDAV